MRLAYARQTAVTLVTALAAAGAGVRLAAFVFSRPGAATADGDLAEEVDGDLAEEVA